MPKLYNHTDKNTDTEFDEVYQRLELYKVSTTTPSNPRSGTMWFNPETGKLKIFKNIQTEWEDIN